MTDPGTLLRETLAEREVLAPPADGLADAAIARARSRRLRRHTLGAVIACVVAGLLAAGLVAVARQALGQKQSAGWSTIAVPGGWRVVSSRGLQVAVPADWPINADLSCGPQPAFSLTRDPGAQPVCRAAKPDARATQVTIEPASDYAERDDALKGRPTSTRQVSLAGAPAILFQGSYADGRTALVLTVPGIDVQVAASGPDADVLERVLQTTRVVEVDDVGCSRDLPVRPAWDRPRPGPAVHPGAPTSVGVCLYEGTVLGASARLSGSQATALVTAMTASRPGPDPDNARLCAAGLPESTPLWLHLHYLDGTQQDVRVRFSGCVSRWMASPTGVSRVSIAVLRAAIDPLHVAFVAAPDLPAR